MKTYTFTTQLADGAAGEARLDQYFTKWFAIRPATMEEQRAGIDRHFTRHRDQATFSVEYKTDHTAGRTGNAFVETVSVDTLDRPGWALSSQAQLLIYYVPTSGAVYVIEFRRLRLALRNWQQRYPRRSIPNDGYQTHGYLVPLMEFEKIAVQVLPI